MTYFIWACLLGAISAVSLPLGSWVGLRYQFLPNQISVLSAFGAGALLAALSVELIAPTTLALVDGEGAAGGHTTEPFFAMIVGCVIGGLIYVLLDNLVNKQGGFLRKTSTVLRYYKKVNREQQEMILERLAAIPLFQDFPAEHVETLLEVLEPVTFKDGDVILEEGEPADATFLLLEGTIEARLGHEKIHELEPGEVVANLIPMFLDVPNVATGVAKGQVKALRISKAGFDLLRELSDEFDRVCRTMAADRLESLGEIVSARSATVLTWLADSRSYLSGETPLPDALRLSRAKKEHHGAPLAVWLGILLDGIPESLVIGAGMAGMLAGRLAATGTVEFVDVIPFTLIAGLFLSNFPEALSSSANMLAQGWEKTKVFLMWFSLMVITALGAGLGYLLAGVLDHTWLVMFEGIAAGAMLTMIAATMIPEAVLMGSGNTVGLSTLAGFLGAILFKLLE